ncbi:actin-domain-containing protein [Lipomyces arxii]|uniref:actin-domain-containing protein n=1 Tax=Lipomyces arxii TaxID=56418 RepID=UPI0034CF6BF5
MSTNEIEVTRNAPSLLRSSSSPAPSSPSALGSSPLLLSPATRQQHTDPPVILDIGARGIRAGIAGMDQPVCEIAIEPYSRDRVQTYELWDIDLRKTRLEDVHDMLQVVLRDVYYKYLLLDGRSRKVIVLENPMMPIVLKKAIAFVLFNYFQAISATFILSPLCSMVSAGARNAIVVDIGWHEITVTPIYDYKPLLPCVQSSNRAGKMLHALVSKRLETFTDTVPTFSETEEFIARAMYCLETDVDPEPSTAQHAFAVTLSGNTFYVPSAETRYNPVVECFMKREPDEMDDTDSFAIPDLIVACLVKLGIDTRAAVLSRIIFVGGCSNVPGLKTRILQQVRAELTTESTAVHAYFVAWNVHDPLRIKAIKSLGPWCGASLYIAREREYILSGGGSDGSQRRHRTSFRITGEIERDRFLLDRDYADNIFDWTVPWT